MSQTEPGPVSLQDVVTISPDVVFRTLDGEAVLLNVRSGVYFELNQTGTAIWNILADNGSLQTAHSRIVEQYAVEPEVARRDILQLTAALLEVGLIAVLAGK